MTLEPLTPARRQEMTRRHLLEAAATVFGEHGFHRATLDQVATAAGFTKGAVYSNFASKDDLFLALLDDRMDRQRELLADLMDSAETEGAKIDLTAQLVRSAAFFGNDSWSALYLEFVVYARRHPEAQKKLAAIAARSREYVTQMLADEFDRTGVSRGYQPEDVASVLIAVFEGIGIGRLVDPTAGGERAFDTLLSVLSASLSTSHSASYSAPPARG